MTLPQRVAAPFGLLTLLILGATLPSAPFQPTTAPRVATAPSTPQVPDTLRASAERDTPLILSLPSSVENRSVAEYRLLRGPALSGVAGRSFTWIPHGAHPGRYEAMLGVRHPDPPPDTLVIRIDLQP